MTPADSALSPADYVDRILGAAAAWEIHEYDRLTIAARECLPPLALVREVFAPILREAGDRWERGEFSIVQEHMLTSTVRRQLHFALDEHNRRASGPRIAFTTLSGERHELGSLMLAVLAASRGVNAVYLGPDLPAAEVGRFCGKVAVGAVAVSIVSRPEVIDARRQLSELRSMLPLSIELWIGGRAAEFLPASDLPERARIVTDLDELNELITKLPIAESQP
jgi:MerR family transcriptional regulator, light-induced transcriptional regulator